MRKEGQRAGWDGEVGGQDKQYPGAKPTDLKRSQMIARTGRSWGQEPRIGLGKENEKSGGVMYRKPQEYVILAQQTPLSASSLSVLVTPKRSNHDSGRIALSIY